MKLRIIFPDFECRLASNEFGELIHCIRVWLSEDVYSGQFMWAFASRDRIYLQIGEMAVGASVPPDYPHRLMEIGYLQEAAFENERVYPGDLASGIWGFSEADARKFLGAVVANAYLGIQEMFLELLVGGVWRCGAMPSFSRS